MAQASIYFQPIFKTDAIKILYKNTDHSMKQQLIYDFQEFAENNNINDVVLLNRLLLAKQNKQLNN